MKQEVSEEEAHRIYRDEIGYDVLLPYCAGMPGPWWHFEHPEVEPEDREAWVAEHFGWTAEDIQKRKDEWQ